MTLAQKLKTFWGQEKTFKHGVSENDLRQFEQRHNILLPHDFRSFLLEINGNAFDQNLISIHSLRDLAIRPIECVGRKTFCIFADYSINVYKIAFEVQNAGPEPARVYALGADPVRIAHSFAEFVDRCVENDAEAMMFWAGSFVMTQENIDNYRQWRKSGGLGSSWTPKYIPAVEARRKNLHKKL